MKQKDSKIEFESAAWDMLYLVQCSICGRTPSPQRVSAMDLEKVYICSRRQSLESITYLALECLMQTNPMTVSSNDKEVIARWAEARNKAIRKTMLMDAARKHLFAYLEERKIWYVALKGIVLCELYPVYGMRQMSDNDILFDASFRKEVHDWFVEQGYSVESFGTCNHDVYHKKPVYNFEMHTALFREDEQPGFAKYYLTIKERLEKVTGKQFEYSLSDEDFYLYMLAHDYKHFSDGGMGLRSLLDIYIYNQAKTGMNRLYIEKELQVMGLLQFEKERRELAQNVFSQERNADELSEDKQTILKALLFSGTYGTMEKHCENQLRKIQSNGNKITVSVKLYYLRKRLFPSKAAMEVWCKQQAPFFLNYRWLFWAAPIWRIVKGMKEKKTQVFAELDAVKKC